MNPAVPLTIPTTVVSFNGYAISTEYISQNGETVYAQNPIKP